VEAFGELIGIGLLLVVILLASVAAAVVGTLCLVLWRPGWLGRQFPRPMTPLPPDDPPPLRMETADIQPNQTGLKKGAT
jgi:hypothetical protein